MKATWYNEARVKQPGSVILQNWNAERQAKRAVLAGAEKRKRMYAGAAINRLSGDWGALNTSADSEILTSLRMLRGRSRELVRDNEYAGAAMRTIKNNVIGTGIGMQAQVATVRGILQPKINEMIEDAWAEWCDKDQCDPAGDLCFADMERMIMGSIAENGEVLVRKVRQPFGAGKTPYALELIEADRLVDQWSSARASNGNMIRMGKEQDRWGRTVAYWLYPNHPGDYQFSDFVESALMRVPADEIIHLFIPLRVRQTRGIPWMHATLKRLRNMAGYEEAEIVAARAAASVVGIIQSPEPMVGDGELLGEDGDSDGPMLNMTPGTFQQLAPGETFQGFNPARNNAALDPFMRYMLRAFATGVGVSYETVSGDYSQSNYSSTRLRLVDDRDNWRVIQGWIIRNFRLQVHKDWLEASVLAGVLPFADFYTNRKRYEKVLFKPRGWGWIDPVKEVSAYRLAVRSGFITVSDVIRQTSEHSDASDVFKLRRQELDEMAELDLVFDTDPGQVDDKGTAQPLPTAKEDDKEEPDDPDEEAEGGDPTV